MRVVVFGGAGFLGSHVADELTASGHEVIIFDIHESPYLHPQQTMVVGNILDETAVQNAVMGCDVVYNFAGIADIDECACRPVDTVRYNILGNAIILEASRKAKVHRFVFASSVYVYSEAGSMYRASKQACELFIENYWRAYGLPFTILRYGSLYGERADERNSIYRLLKQVLTTGRIYYNGTGDEVREYIHVKDAAALSVEVLKPAYENQYIILTGNTSMKYRDMLEMIREMLGNKVEIIYGPKKSETHYKLTPYSFNPKLGRKLVRNPQIDLGQGLLSCMSEIYESIHKEKYMEMGLFVNNGLQRSEQAE